MNRRGFLSSLIAVPAAAWLSPNVLATSAPLAQVSVNVGAAVCAAWESYIRAEPLDNIFTFDRNAPMYFDLEYERMQ